MLHHFVDKNECELAAIMCWSTRQYAVSAIDTVNRFYKHPDILIGARKDSVQFTESNYSKAIADSNHSYLKLTMDQDEIAGAIEGMMLGEF